MRERLNVTLSLTFGGSTHAIPGGNVRLLALEMTTWGVEGSIELVMQDGGALQGNYVDDLLEDFLKPDLGEVRLAIEAAHLDAVGDPGDARIATGGIITHREFREEVHQKSLDAGVALYRRYRLRFVDPAAALWRQHFPCDLFTNKSFKDAIEAHKGDKIAITYDWDAITRTAPQIFFHLDPSAGASFYDLVLGWIATGGVFSFDHDEISYAVTGAKKQDGEAPLLRGEDVAEMTWILPPVPRHTPRVLCSYTEATRSEAATNANAAAGIYHDTLLRTPIAQEVDDAVAAAKAAPLLPGDEVALSLRSFPGVPMAPGHFLTISTRGGHSAALRLPAEALRIVRLTVDARALVQDDEADFGDKATNFELSISAHLEKKDEPITRWPALTSPRYPGTVEGKVVSEVGEDTDLTYQPNEDEATSIDRYRVKIPLFGDQIVVVPYEPATGAGAIYFPLYKGQRVLVALDMGRAWVVRLLDWRAEAHLPAAGQGQHVFFGKSQKQSTSLLHDYQDDKPVLRLLRQNDKDTILFKMEEGKLTLKVEETKG